MKAWIISVMFVLSLCALSISAVDYFADGCMVIDRKGKLVKTEDGYVFAPTVKCRQHIIITEEGKRRAN